MEEYHGNCHCGRFKYTLTIPPLKSVKMCNCSICVRNGYLFVIVHDDQLKYEQGYEGLKGYQFNQHVRTHKFCPHCGTSLLNLRHNDMDGHAVGVNVRALNNIDIDALEKVKSDAASRPVFYKPPQAPAMEEDPSNNLKVYSGNCHCGAVRYSVRSKPLSEIEVMSCNCSHCSRNGDLFIYPKKSNVIVEGKENLTGYAFLHDDSLHSFCKNCGGSVLVQVLNEDIMPINVRTMNGIDIESLKLKRYDGWKNDPQYVVQCRCMHLVLTH